MRKEICYSIIQVRTFHNVADLVALKVTLEFPTSYTINHILCISSDTIRRCLKKQELDALGCTCKKAPVFVYLKFDKSVLIMINLLSFLGSGALILIQQQQL